MQRTTDYRAPLSIATFLSWAVLLVGCGPNRPATAHVSGVVTVNGAPLTEGRITFYPSEGRSATTAIQADGTFSLTTFEEGDGALPGEHVVTVKATHTEGTGPTSFEQELQGTAPPSQITWLTDPSYARRETSPLRATVRLDESNEFLFELKR